MRYLVIAIAFSIASCSKPIKQDPFLLEYSGRYSVEIGESQWSEVYVLEPNGNAKWIFSDVREANPKILNILTGTWTASEYFMKISIKGNPNGIEEYQSSNGVFHCRKADFMRYLKPIK